MAAVLSYESVAAIVLKVSTKSRQITSSPVSAAYMRQWIG